MESLGAVNRRLDAFIMAPTSSIEGHDLRLSPTRYQLGITWGLLPARLVISASDLPPKSFYPDMRESAVAG